MTLQLHKPDGEGGLEPRPASQPDWREQLQSPRWGSDLSGDRLPALENPEMNPTSRFMSVLFWLGLGFVTFALLVVGYGIGFWNFAPAELTGTSWELVAITTRTPAFQGVVPPDVQTNYTIEFATDDTFAAKADCNQVTGTYATTSAGGMTITAGASTVAACPEGSLDTKYVAGLGMAESYAIDGNRLTITLTDEGTLQFE
jgi:heat shock protein HslJ